jgi:hypothetical protein
MGFLSYDEDKGKCDMQPTKNSLSLGGEENKRIRLLEETWRYGVVNVKYLAVMAEDVYDEGEKEYKLPKDVRVRDSVSRYVKELVEGGLLKRWPKVGKGGFQPLTLTEKGEKFLERYGYEHRGYAKRFGKTESLHYEHHLMVTRCSLAFLMACEIQEVKGEVLPAIPVDSVWPDKVWTMEDKTVLVECERSKKSNDKIRKKLDVYAQSFKQGKLTRTRVLWIAERAGQLPLLMRLGQEMTCKACFLFTHEGRFLNDVQKILVDPIWQFCDGEETYL